MRRLDMGRRLRALALAGALIAASAGLATTTATAAASAPPLSTGTLRSSSLFGKLKIDFTGNCCQDGTVGTSYSQEFTATGGGGSPGRGKITVRGERSESRVTARPRS